MSRADVALVILAAVTMLGAAVPVLGGLIPQGTGPDPLGALLAASGLACITVYARSVTRG